MTTDPDHERERLRVLALRRRAIDGGAELRNLDLFGPREQLGLVLPELRCCGCTNRIISLICWDAERNLLSCIRCAAVLHRLDPEGDRFYTLSIEARDSIPGMGYLPLAEAREILLRFGAREP